MWLRTAAGHELLEDREQLPVLCHGGVGLRRVRNHRAARLVHLTTRAQTVIRENDENKVSKHVHEIAEEL